MDRFTNPPIERHEALAPFSRDHYNGLVHARRLVNSASGDRAQRHQALAGFLDAWEREIAQHFRDEERLLIEQMGELVPDPERRRLLEEHREIEADAALARKLRRETDPDARKLREIGERLERHIRWEERSLFELIQRRASQNRLEDLGRETAAIEASRPRNACRTPPQG